MILAFLYRLRGQHEESTTTTEARLIYWTFPLMLLFGIVAEMYGLPKWWAILSGIMVFIGISMGHSFAQGATGISYSEMGLVCLTRLEMAFLPFLTAPCCGYKMQPVLWVLLPVFFLMTWAASWLSYQPFFQSKTLNLFGMTWCAPGDSSWEEWLIGLCYDVVFWVLFLVAMLGR